MYNACSEWCDVTAVRYVLAILKKTIIPQKKIHGNRKFEIRTGTARLRTSSRKRFSKFYPKSDVQLS